jgi:hypothetical protein
LGHFGKERACGNAEYTSLRPLFLIKVKIRLQGLPREER